MNRVDGHLSEFDGKALVIREAASRVQRVRKIKTFATTLKTQLTQLSYLQHNNPTEPDCLAFHTLFDFGPNHPEPKAPSTGNLLVTMKWIETASDFDTRKNFVKNVSRGDWNGWSF